MIGTCPRCRGSMRLKNGVWIPKHGACDQVLPLEVDPQGILNKLASTIQDRALAVRSVERAMAGEPIYLTTPLEVSTNTSEETHYMLSSDHPKYEEMRAICCSQWEISLMVIDHRIEALIAEFAAWQPKRMAGEDEEVFRNRLLWGKKIANL